MKAVPHKELQASEDDVIKVRKSRRKRAEQRMSASCKVSTNKPVIFRKY